MLKEEQDSEIEMLEKQMETLRFQHEDKVRAIKTTFLKEKKAFEESMESRIKTMEDVASKVRLPLNLVTSITTIVTADSSIFRPPE